MPVSTPEDVTVPEPGAPRRPGPPAGRRPRRARAETALWAFLVLFALAGVFGHGLWGPNDAREGGMVWDMVRHGTLVTPTSNGTPYWEKPPLMFWVAALFCTVAGHVGAGLVRLPSALAGLGTLVLLFAFVRGWRRDDDARDARDAGMHLDAWAAVFLCATAATFLEYSRVVLTDMTLTFTVTLALYLFWRAFERDRGGAATSALGTARRWLPFLAAASLAFYAKGLVGPALTWCAVGLFLLVRRRWRLLAGLGLAYAACLAVAVGPWAWALWQYRGMEALRSVFWDNQFGRFFTFGWRADLPQDPYFVHKEPWHYYLRSLVPSLAPWTFLVAAGLVAWFRRGTRYRGEFPTFVRCAVIGMLVLLHASSAKVGCYTLPLFPFLFLAAGTFLADAARAERPGRVTSIVAWTSLALMTLVVAAIPAAFLYGYARRPELVRVPGVSPGLAVLAALTLVVIAAGLVASLRGWTAARRRTAWPLAPAAAAALLVPAFWLLSPVMEWHRSLEPVAALVRAELDAGREVALATMQSDDPGGLTFYVDRRLPVIEGEAAVRRWLGESPRRGALVRAGQYPGLAPDIERGVFTARTVAAGGRHAHDFVLVGNAGGQGGQGR